MINTLKQWKRAIKYILGNERSGVGAKIKDKFIIYSKVSLLLNISKPTITRWANNGKLKDNGKKGHGRLISKQSVLDIKHKIETKDREKDLDEYQAEENKIPN